MLTILVAISDSLGITMIMPLLQSFDVDQGEEGKESFLFEVTDFFGVTDSIEGVLMLIFCLFLVKAIFRFFTGYYNSYLGRKLYRFLKLEFLDKLLGVDYKYFSKYNTGHYTAIMTGHTRRLITSFNQFVLFVTSTVMAIAYMVTASLISWPIAISTVVFGGLIILIFRWPNKYLRKLSQLQAKEQKVMGQVTIQAIHALKYLVSTATHPPVRKQFAKSTEALVGYNFGVQMVAAAISASKELVSITVLIAIIILEVFVLGNKISEVLVVILLFYRSVNQLIGIQSSWLNLVGCTGFIESVDTEFANLKAHQVTDEGEEFSKDLNQVSIEAQQLSFKYDDDLSLVLKDLNFRIEPNTSVAFVGPSGAGKTTLVDLLTGLLRDYDGKLLIGDVDFKDYKSESIRRRIGYVSQDLTVFDDSIKNNITLFDEDADIEAVKAAARAAFADDFIEALSDGYETTIGDKGMRISGGQKQRLFIARELYKNPELLILDEATSALDTKSENYIRESIDQLKGKITVVIIAHRLSTIKNVDRIFVLEDGALIEQGDYEELTRGQGDSRFAQMVEGQTL